MSQWIDTGAAFIAPLGASTLITPRRESIRDEVSDETADLQSRIRRLEEENRDLQQQIADLTATLHDRTNQCLQHKQRYEHEQENSRNHQKQVEQLTVEVCAERERSAQLEARALLAETKCEELLLRQQEILQQQQETETRCTELTAAFASVKHEHETSEEANQRRILELERHIADLEHEAKAHAPDISTPDTVPDVSSHVTHLLETKLLEARHLQWLANVSLRESALFFDQIEHIRTVHGELNRLRQDHGGETCTFTALIDHCDALRKMISDLEEAFESSRAQAVTLSERFVSARHDLQAELLYTIEPEIDRIDHIYHSYPVSGVAELNAVCTAINQSIRYRPGESKLKQTQSAESFGGSTSVVYLHSLRADAAALLPVLSSFCTALTPRFKGLRIYRPACLKPLSRVLEDCYINYKGDYAFACDIVQCTLSVSSIEEMKDVIYFLGNMDGERKRIRLPTDMTTGQKMPRFAILAVKNKFIPQYDALAYAAGCRDVCIYLRFAESRHPLHVVEVRLLPQEYVEDGCMMEWISHIVELSKPLRLFNDPARSRFGTISDAAQIKNGIVQSINMDHFSFTTSGGHILISALSQATYSGMQEVSLSNSGVSDDDLMMLLAVLGNHGRLKVLRAAGSRELRGVLTTIPWDVLTMPPRNVLQTTGFYNLQKLDLSANSLHGHIHPFISTALPALRYLNLSDNALTGHIPPDIGNLSNLQHLLLARNELSGPIPPSLGKLASLKDLQLWQNKLTGNIPVEVCHLKCLVRLNIDSCMLSGTLPVELRNLTSLKEFYCFNNQLEGELPPEMFHGLENLQHLGLNGNKLCGKLPSEISQLRKLKTLFLHENFLSGELPLELGSLVELKKLSLRGNKLHGELPYSLWSLSSLTALALAENQFSGPIPVEISQLQNLEAITLSNNQFCGQFPIGLLRIPRIRSIDLTKNQFTGILPPDIGRTTSLQDLLLGDNEMHGLIPPDMGHLKLLTHLELQGNRFEGHLPIVELSNLKKLRALDLSRNHLSGAALAEKHIKDRLKNCFVNINTGQRPSVMHRDSRR